MEERIADMANELVKLGVVAAMTMEELSDGRCDYDEEQARQLYENQPEHIGEAEPQDQ